MTAGTVAAAIQPTSHVQDMSIDTGAAHLSTPGRIELAQDYMMRLIKQYELSTSSPCRSFSLDFRECKVLGHGGFGKVLQCRCDGYKVALKVLSLLVASQVCHVYALRQCMPGMSSIHW